MPTRTRCPCEPPFFPPCRCQHHPFLFSFPLPRSFFFFSLWIFLLRLLCRSCDSGTPSPATCTHKPKKLTPTRRPLFPLSTIKTHAKKSLGQCFFFFETLDRICVQAFLHAMFRPSFCCRWLAVGSKGLLGAPIVVGLNDLSGKLARVSGASALRVPPHKSCREHNSKRKRRARDIAILFCAVCV